MTQNTPQRAVIYLAHPQPDLDDDGPFRLSRLRQYARECGYTVDTVITAHDPDDAHEAPVTYQLIRRALLDEDIDVIVLWHRDLDVPDTLTRADVIPGFPEPVRDPNRHTAPHAHVWVTALDGDNQPALDAHGHTWVHCGICGNPREPAPRIPQTLAPLTVGGNQPKYPVGSQVRYDDATGMVLEHRYSGERDAWDARVDFEDGDEPGWCWESDLTPAYDTEGE